MMEIPKADGSNKRVLVSPAVPRPGSEYPNKRRLVIPAASEQVFAKRLSGRAQQQVIVPSTYGTGGLRPESLGTQERETLMTRIGVLSQERQALEVLLANSEKEKKTWSEICSSTLTSMKGLEAEIEREKQKKEQSGHEAKKQCLEMQSQLLRLTDEKQKILMEKDSEHEALMAKVLELEKCKKDGMRLDGELADAKNDLRRAEETAVRREVDLRRAEEKAKRLEVDLRRAEETTKKREANLIRAEETRKKREAALIQAVETAKMREGELVRAAEETAKRREVELAQAAEEAAKTREAEHVRAAEETAKKWEVELASMTEDRKKLQDSKKKLTLENKLLKQSLVELKDKMVKLEADLGNATMEKKSLIASLDDYRSKAEKLLEDYKSKAKKLQTDCENIQANHQMALDKCDGELLELICERDHCEAALIKSKSMLEKLEKEHTSLQKDYETLNSLKVKEQAGFQLACEACEKTTKKMEVQLQTCRAELSRLSRESHTSIKQKDSVVEKLIAAVSKAEKAKDSAVKELEQKLHLETTSVRRELAIAAKEKNRLAISEASLIQKLDEATKTIHLLNEQQTVSAEEIRSSKLTNHSLVLEIESAKKKQEEIEQELFKLLQEKEASKKAQCELNAEVFKLKEELERIYKEKESLSASVECSNAKIEELNALVEYWAQKKNTLKQQVEVLHCKLSDLDIEKNELAKRFEHECTNVSLLKFKMTWTLKEKDHIAAFANENINALVRKVDSLNKQQQQQQAILVSEKKSSAHANDVSMQESKNLLVTIPLLDKENDSFSPSKTEEVLTSEEALKTEHDSAMEVHHVKAALDVAVKEEVEPFAESSLQQKLDYVAGMMDFFVEQIAAKVKENDAMRAELTLMDKKSNHMQKTIEGERSASTGLERKLEMLKKELSGMEKKFEIAVLDKRRARSHVTDSKKECEDLARQLVSKDKTLIAKEKENARLLQSRDALATNCINLRAALSYMEKENTNLRKEVVDARFISHHLEGEVERLRKDVLGMPNGLPCAVVNGNVRSSAVEVQGLSSIQPTVLSLPQNCDISVQIETMRGELACLRHENRVLNDCMHKCQMELDARSRAHGDPRRELQPTLGADSAGTFITTYDMLRASRSKDSCSRKHISENGNMLKGTTQHDRLLKERQSKEICSGSEHSGEHKVKSPSCTHEASIKHTWKS
ncbi:unnamed protein product [Sphagnum jensenii]|uniref:Uncharacterized protein n=1 Tax=Sphagnum jensenii TaxID=128206 RepID=A0ABP0VSA0_9BRYO